MSSPSRIVLVLALGCWICGSAGGQASTTSPEPPILTISGEVSRPSKLTASDFAKLPRQTITAKDHNGQPATFEGVALSEILQRAGVEFGEQLRGKNLALFAVVDAADGYRVVFALPELDPRLRINQSCWRTDAKVNRWQVMKDHCESWCLV